MTYPGQLCKDRSLACVHILMLYQACIYLPVVVLAIEISNKRNTTLCEVYTHKETLNQGYTRSVSIGLVTI